MFRGPVVLALVVAGRMFAANVQLLPPLPDSAVSGALQLDAAGDIFVAGWFTPASVLDPSNAFVAKLSPDGSKLLYFTVLAGSQADGATALVLGPDGSAYVAGYTASSDFPVTAGAFDSTYSADGLNQGFLVKVNPAGTVVYSSFIGGTVPTQVTGMALDSAGDVFLTGVGGPTVTVFVDGLGPVTPALATGAITAQPARLTPPVNVADSTLAPLSSTTRSLPGSITGVAQVQVLLPPVSGPVALFIMTPTVNGVALRERLMLIWVRSQ